MPQGPTGLEPDAWQQEWILTAGTSGDNSDISSLHGRGRSAVQAHYQASLPLSDPWAAARDALFGGLMSGFENLSEFLGDIAEAIAGAGKRALEDITVTISNIANAISLIFSRLWDAAGNFIANVAGAIVDGVKSMADFLSGLWDALTGNTNSSGKTVDDITVELSGVASDASTASSTSATNAENLQTTWNELYDGLNGTTGSTNKTPTDVRTRGAAVRQKAFDADDKAGLAQIEALGALGAAETAQGAAETAQGAADTAQDAADTAQDSADDANALIDSRTIAGDNLVTNPGFENSRLSPQGGQWWTQAARIRSGSRSLRVAGDGQYRSHDLFVNGSQLLFLEATAGDRFVVDVWVWGESVNPITTGNLLWLETTEKYDDNRPQTNTVLGGITGDACRGGWTKFQFWYTVPVDCVGFRLYLVTNCPSPNVFYVDDVVVKNFTFTQRVVDGVNQAVNGGTGTGADVSSVRDNVALVNLAAAEAAISAQGAQQTATEADGNVRSTWDSLYDTFAGTNGSSGRGLAEVQSVGAVVRQTAIDAEDKADAAQDAADAAKEVADEAELKSVAAQSALNEVAKSGSNIAANPGCESTVFLLSTPATEYSTALKRSGSRSIKMTGITGQNIDVQFFKSVVAPIITLPVTEGDVLYFEAWIRGGSGNTKTAGAIRPYLLSGDPASPTMSYPPNIAVYTGTLTSLNAGWQKLSGFYIVPAGAVGLQCVVQLHTSAGTGCFLHVDDLVCYRITEAYYAQLEAEGALGAAGTAASAADTAQGAAELAQEAADSKVPQTFFDAGQRGGDNLCTNPVFSDTSQYLWSANASYSTDYKRTGTHSAKVSNNGTHDYYVSVINRSDNSGNAYVTVYPGQVFYCEFYVYQTGGSNSSTVSMYVQLFDYDLTYRGGTFAAAPTFTAANNGVWTKVSGFYIVPNPPANVNYAQARFLLRSHSNTAAGTVRYFDDVIVRDVTEAYYAQQEAEGALGAAGTAQGAAETAQGAAETADEKAVVAKSLANSALQAGPNLATNPSFENSNLAIRKSLSNYSTDQARTGSQSFKTAGNTYSWMFSDENGWITLPCTPGDIYAVEMWVYGKQDNATITGGYATAHFQTYDTAGALVNTTYIGGLYLSAAAANAAKGVWTKLAGTIVIPANAASFQVTAAITNFTPSNVTFYWDDFACYRITEAQAAQIEAEGALGAAGTAQGAAETAQGAAETADEKAVTAQDLGYQLGSRGANLLPNGSFENSNFFIGASANRGYSSEAKRSGTQSLRCKGYMWTPLFANNSSFYLTSPCAAGDKIYYEIYVMGASGNVASARTCYIQTLFFDQAGNYIANSMQYPASVNAGTGLNGAWTKLSGIATAPANAASHDFTIVQLSSTVSGTEANNVYFWDDAKCYRVTEAYNAQEAADTAKDTADDAQDSADLANTRQTASVAAGDNLVSNPGFEFDNFYLEPYNSRTQAKKRSGSWSVTWNSIANTYQTQDMFVSKNERLWLDVTPGERLYIEGWIYGADGNANSSNTAANWQVSYTLSDGTGGAAGLGMSVTPNACRGQWTKFGGYWTVPANYAKIRLYWVSYVPTSNLIFYVDDCRVLRVSPEADLAQATVDAVAASGNLVISPNFEDTSITRSIYTANAGTYEYVTDSPYEGSRCLKFTVNTPAWNGIFLAPSMNKFRFDVKPGDTYRASVQFKPGASLRTRSGTAYLFMRFKNTSTISDVTAQKGLGSTSTGWQEFSATHTCPPGYHILEVMFLVNSAALANDFFFLDAASVENITPSAAITEKLYGSKAAIPADTIISASIPEFDGSKIISGSVAEDRVQNLTANLTLFNANNSAGANLVPDPSFEDATLDVKRKATSGSVANWWTAVTDIVHSGSRAMEITYATSGNAYPSLQLTPTLTPNWSAPGYDNVRIACRPGQVFYLSQWVYLRPGNTGTREMNLYLATFNAAGTIQYMWVQAFPALETWTKIEGYFKVTRSDVVSVVPLFGAFRPGNSLNAKAIVDDCEMFDVTDSYNRTQTTWDNLYDAFNGTTGSSNRTIDEVRQRGAAVRQKANDADDKAVLAQSDLNAIATSNNKVISPNFEDPSIARIVTNSGGTVEYTTETYFEGTRCLKFNFNSGTYNGFWLAPTQTEMRIFCKPGDTIFASIMVRLRSGDTQPASGGWRLFIVFSNSRTGAQTQAIAQLAYTQLSTTWQEMSVFGTCPAGYDRYEVSLGTTGPAVGNVYYFDSAVVREVTDSNKINQALYNQNTPLSNILESKLPSNIDGSKIQTGSVASDRIQNLPASKITSGSFAEDRIPTLAQSKVTSLTTDLDKNKQLGLASILASSNLCTNPGFEQPDFVTGAYCGYDTAFKRTGARSIKATHNGSGYVLINMNPAPNGVSASGRMEIPVVGNSVFYLEAWLYGDQGNVNTSSNYWFQWYWRRQDGSTNTAGTVGHLNAGTARNGVWTKMSGYITAPEDAVALSTIWVVGHNIIPSGNMYWVDDPIIHLVSNSTLISDQAVTTDKLKDNAVTGAKQSLLDASKIVSGQIQPDIVANLPQNKVNGLPAGEEAGNEALRATIFRLSDELAALKAESEGAETYGQKIKVNFSEYGNQTNLATQTALPDKTWTVTSTGPTWGVVDGVAKFTGNVSGTGTAKIIYQGDPANSASAKTFTDAQKLRGVIGQIPDGYNQSSGGPEFTALGRVSDDGNSYVWATARFVSQLNLRGSIGCKVGSTTYTWATDIPLGFATEMTFILGTDSNNLRKYQVYSGTDLVWTHTETGSSSYNAAAKTSTSAVQSSLGSGFRKFGGIFGYQNGMTGGGISSLTLSDNLPVEYKGSVARMHRTATADTGTMSTSDNALPTDFFAAPLFASQDITANSTNGTFKVSDGKMYVVNARIQLATHSGQNCRIDLQVSTDNGASWTTTQRGATTWAYDSFHHTQAQDYAVTGHWLQYLNAGDMVRLVTRANTGTKTNFLTGGPAGTTYFTISAVS